jgi:predicted nucleic acid-binding Zn ribbon protein
MLKKLLFIFILLIGGFFFFNINQIQAEGICHIRHCFIPAPTIVVPENNIITAEKRPAVRGLTWKRTLVDIYLDGQYQDSVLLKEHEDYLQSFFWRPTEDLIVGEHYVYTIAYNSRGYDKNLKGWDQSKESTYIYFTIIEDKDTLLIKEENQNLVKPISPQISSAEKEATILEQVSSNTESTVSDEAITPIKNIFEGERQKRRQKNLRIFGFIILIVFIIILIVNHYLKRKREYINSIIEKVKVEKGGEDKHDNGPPPPPPVNQDSLGI